MHVAIVYTGKVSNLSAILVILQLNNMLFEHCYCDISHRNLLNK